MILLPTEIGLDEKWGNKKFNPRVENDKLFSRAAHPFRIVHVLTFAFSAPITYFPFRHRFDLLPAVSELTILAVHTLTLLIHLTVCCFPEEILELSRTLLVVTWFRVYWSRGIHHHWLQHYKTKKSFKLLHRSTAKGSSVKLPVVIFRAKQTYQAEIWYLREMELFFNIFDGKFISGPTYEVVDAVLSSLISALKLHVWPFQLNWVFLKPNLPTGTISNEPTLNSGNS